MLSFVFTGCLLHGPVSVRGAIYPVFPWRDAAGGITGNHLLPHTQVRQTWRSQG